ncbi:RNA-directed DNA polymerase, eukaryota [Tanacetum coccineum]|uniref:RNA-directed DNA polymerase, eukaryota n=1 Tax=Tanacetum coccineum TaxID=301880 RepID=A0ABQ5GZT7_9ASTR
MAARARSNVDHTRLISKSIFVTNFSDNTTSKDLWEACKGYGTVVDVFIPDLKSKAGSLRLFEFIRDNGDISKQMNLDDESDIEGVSDTVFDDKADSLGHEHTQNLSPNEKENSSDPFNLYNLLNKRDKGEANSGLDSSIPFPPGFTPEREFQHVDAQEVQGMENSLSKRRSEGGSILEVIDDMIKVGQSMGFTMEGCMNDMEKIIGSQGAHGVLVQETKLDCISDMDVKVLWGNYKFEYTISEAVGNSGGILCVWDPSVFRKEHHVVSDNFVALYGSWVSNQAKLLVVSIYAPQSITSKCSLWSYILSLISRWDGHCMVMGDFNEVRCMEDRLGSVYNAQGANEFNSFISNSGLVEIQLEGYSFTWSLQSAKKMSTFGSFRPIFLQEVVTDYGPSPFRVYHSWFSLQGFDQMVLETWNNIDLNDNNKMVRFKKKLQILKRDTFMGVMVDGEMGGMIHVRVKDNFVCHFANRVRSPEMKCVMMLFGGAAVEKLNLLRPDGFTFEFFRKFWDTLGSDFCAAVEWFFDHSSFSRGWAPFQIGLEIHVTGYCFFICGGLLMSMHGSSLYKLSPFCYSTWKSIIWEVHMLKDRGVDQISHCHIHVGNGLRTQFWNEVWIGDTQLRVMFLRIYALEINKDCTVADKLQFSVTSSLRRSVRGGVKSSQLALLQTYIEGTLLS